MNQELIDMAREAGFYIEGKIIRNEEGYNDQTSTIEKFANIVRNQALEDAANFAETVNSHGVFVMEGIRAMKSTQGKGER